MLSDPCEECVLYISDEFRKLCRSNNPCTTFQFYQAQQATAKEIFQILESDGIIEAPYAGLADKYFIYPEILWDKLKERYGIDG